MLHAIPSLRFLVERHQVFHILLAPQEHRASLVNLRRLNVQDTLRAGSSHPTSLENSAELNRVPALVPYRKFVRDGK